MEALTPAQRTHIEMLMDYETQKLKYEFGDELDIPKHIIQEALRGLYYLTYVRLADPSFYRHIVQMLASKPVTEQPL